ncbi:MAG: carboxypeptidase-like regulatory domain-containing protein [Spirochaetaceae bacterium]|nr:carboxypeptidase-like regulatory domain-containing protein [Spirochaetaceae bacterium]
MHIWKKPFFWICFLLGTFVLVGICITLRINYLRKEYSQSFLAITGICTNYDGKVIPSGHFNVRLYNSQKVQIERTNVLSSDGEFSFFPLQPETYYLKFSKLGAPDVWYRDGEPIILKDTDIHINFRYLQGYSITEKFTDSNDRNVSVIDNILLYNHQK